MSTTAKCERPCRGNLSVEARLSLVPDHGLSCSTEDWCNNGWAKVSCSWTHEAQKGLTAEVEHVQGSESMGGMMGEVTRLSVFAGTAGRVLLGLNTCHTEGAKAPETGIRFRLFRWNSGFQSWTCTSPKPQTSYFKQASSKHAVRAVDAKKTQEHITSSLISICTPPISRNLALVHIRPSMT